jgi:predicted enzyme related to lactoylglutathione lyase
MADRSGYVQGTPCWVDLSAADVEGAHRFYGELFGWQFEDTGDAYGEYTMCTLQGARVAGLVPAGRGDRTGWTMYLASDDVDETALRTADHGGTLLADPQDVGAAGRMCVAADPSGAVFGVWEAVQHAGAQKVNEPGAMCWNEVNTRDGKAVDDFYRAVFGVKTEQIGDGVNFDYTVFLVEGRQVAGRLRMNDDWPADESPHWMNYFAVDDCDKAAERVAELGGTVRQAPFDSPYGRIAVIADPWGSPLSLMRLADNPPA